MDYIQLKEKDVKELREKLLFEQNNKCLLCGKIIPQGKAVLDHQHKLKKSDKNGENGNGLVRGVLCNNCNQIEGKITSALKRFGQITKTEDKITFLENLIQYYKNGTTNYIHPSEKEPQKIVSKRQYNKLKKLCEVNEKIPEYPKSKHLTKKLDALFKKYNINPFLKIL